MGPFRLELVAIPFLADRFVAEALRNRARYRSDVGVVHLALVGCRRVHWLPLGGLTPNLGARSDLLFCSATSCSLARPSYRSRGLRCSLGPVGSDVAVPSRQPCSLAWVLVPDGRSLVSLRVVATRADRRRLQYLGRLQGGGAAGFERPRAEYAAGCRLVHAWATRLARPRATESRPSALLLASCRGVSAGPRSSPPILGGCVDQLSSRTSHSRTGDDGPCAGSVRLDVFKRRRVRPRSLRPDTSDDSPAQWCRSRHCISDCRRLHGRGPHPPPGTSIARGLAHAPNARLFPACVLLA